ncbi:MAG: tetratricopeptide repeat protein [Myxococcales bacterium]|nr:tetratricopeptide repeat protein [Myxococcales bacterium]MDH5565525.1 tetratricopeptide repeat protein [Myxococcales bacterium]
MHSAAARRLLCALVALSLLGAWGCARRDESARRWRDEIAAALGRGERRAALEAIRAFRAHAPDAPETLVEVASQLARAGEAAEAVWLLEDALTRFPDRDDLRLALGNAALLVADPARARSAVEPVVDASPHAAGALLVRARAALALGDLESALRSFRAAEASDPKSPARWLRIATLVEARRLDEARTQLDGARAEAGSDEAQAELRRADLWLSSVESADPARQAAALGHLEALVAQAPQDPAGWRTWAEALRRAGRGGEAREALRRALDDTPGRRDLRHLLAELEAAAGHPDAAEAILEALLEDEASPADFLALAQLYTATDRPQRAAQIARRGLRASPDSFALLRSLTESLIDLARFAEADSELARLRAFAPESPDAEFLAARLALARGEPERALGPLQDRVTRTDDAAAHYWLGRVLEAQGDLAGAERRYQLAAVRSPDARAPRRALLRAALRREHAPSAADYARGLLELEPDALEAWCVLARALAASGAADAAQAIARQAIARFPDRHEAALALAFAQRTRGAHADARRTLESALARFGALPELDAERALLLGAGGDAAQGLDVADQALALHPDAAPLHRARAALLFQLGRADAGARALDRALALAPGDPTPLKDRARFRASAGELDAARADCARYLAQRPDDAEAHFLLGAVQRAAGRPAEAIAAYRRAAELDARAWAARNNLALLLAERGELDAALHWAQEAYALAEHEAQVKDTLGWLYLQRGLLDRAIALLEAARATAPALVEPRLHLALAYREAGRDDAAQRVLADLAASHGGRESVDRSLGAALRDLE